MSIDIPCLDAWYGLARLNPDGSLNPSFIQRQQEVPEVVLQPDGMILVAGGETGLIRLFPDGTLDPSLSVSAPRVYSVALQDDGRLFIAGAFTTVNSYPMRGIARLNNDPFPVPFVRRQIADTTVQLVAMPPTNVSVYAVEDQPPAGWPVSQISHDGVFDVATGKVKFGPFYDAQPRTLSYQVLPPVWSVHCALGVFCYSGQASADGVNSPVEGQDTAVPVDFQSRRRGCKR